MTGAVVVRIWVGSLLACAALVVCLFEYVDVPVAVHFWARSRHLSPLGETFGATILLSAESAVVLYLVIARLVRGHISVLGRTVVIACLTSMCAYVVNDHVLKVACGVPGPADVMRGARHSFNLWMGSEGSSFPSGHMALAAAFAGVFMRLHRASIGPFSALLLLAAALLLLGDWHFLSDIVAGAFLGTTAGILAAEGWAAHSG